MVEFVILLLWSVVPYGQKPHKYISYFKTVKIFDWK